MASLEKGDRPSQIVGDSIDDHLELFAKHMDGDGVVDAEERACPDAGGAGRAVTWKEFSSNQFS